jgi:hypothetical protein
MHPDFVAPATQHLTCYQTWALPWAMAGAPCRPRTASTFTPLSIIQQSAFCTVGGGQGNGDVYRNTWIDGETGDRARR